MHFEILLNLVSLYGSINISMKRFFLSAFAVAAVGFGLVGCNNGDYDANPDVDNSDKINPFNPKGGIHTGFDWAGVGPMSCEVNGNVWKANQGGFDTITWTDFNGNPIGKFVEIYGLRDDQSPQTQISLSLEHSKVQAGSELDLNWNAGHSYGDIIANLDSLLAGAKDPENYVYSAGFSSVGRAKILEYEDGQHIKGYFYFIGRNPQGYYINVQKGYFDLYK